MSNPIPQTVIIITPISTWHRYHKLSQNKTQKVNTRHLENESSSPLNHAILEIRENKNQIPFSKSNLQIGGVLFDVLIFFYFMNVGLNAEAQAARLRGSPDISRLSESDYRVHSTCYISGGPARAYY